MLPLWAIDGMNGGGWQLESPSLVLSLASPIVGIIFIYIIGKISVMGRAGHIFYKYNLIQANSYNHQMQQVTLITLTYHTHTRYAPRPDYFDLQVPAPHIVGIIFLIYTESP